MPQWMDGFIARSGLHRSPVPGHVGAWTCRAATYGEADPKGIYVK